MNEADQKIIELARAAYAPADIEVPDNAELCRVSLVRDEVWIRAWVPVRFPKDAPDPTMMQLLWLLAPKEPTP
jgi:hypothetical protein